MRLSGFGPLAVAAAAGVVACQSLVGIDDYEPAAAVGGQGGGATSSVSVGGSAGGAGGAGGCVPWTLHATGDDDQQSVTAMAQRDGRLVIAADVLGVFQASSNLELSPSEGFDAVHSTRDACLGTYGGGDSAVRLGDAGNQRSLAVESDHLGGFFFVVNGMRSDFDVDKAAGAYCNANLGSTPPTVMTEEHTWVGRVDDCGRVTWTLRFEGKATVASLAHDEVHATLWVALSGSVGGDGISADGQNATLLQVSTTLTTTPQLQRIVQSLPLGGTGVFVPDLHVDPESGRLWMLTSTDTIGPPATSCPDVLSPVSYLLDVAVNELGEDPGCVALQGARALQVSSVGATLAIAGLATGPVRLSPEDPDAVQFVAADWDPFVATYAIAPNAAVRLTSSARLRGVEPPVDIGPRAVSLAMTDDFLYLATGCAGQQLGLCSLCDTGYRCTDCADGANILLRAPHDPSGVTPSADWDVSLFRHQPLATSPSVVTLGPDQQPILAVNSVNTDWDFARPGGPTINLPPDTFLVLNEPTFEPDRCLDTGQGGAGGAGGGG